jgi:hypothetical protein
MMTEYNPLQAPDPDEWLALDESERIQLVLKYHTQTQEEMPNITIHSTIHAVVENQAAMGDELPVREAVDRLMKEGLNRHDAIHAVGSILIKYIFDVSTGKNISEDFSQDYFDEVSELTAQKWFDEFE